MTPFLSCSFFNGTNKRKMKEGKGRGEERRRSKANILTTMNLNMMSLPGWMGRRDCSGDKS